MPLGRNKVSVRAINHDEPGIWTFDRHAQLLKGLDRAEAVLSVEKIRDLADAVRKCGQHDGAVGDALVSRHDDLGLEPWGPLDAKNIGTHGRFSRIARACSRNNSSPEASRSRIISFILSSMAEKSSNPASNPARFSRRISRHIAAGPAAIRVVSRYPPPARE